jgi:3-oxoacyl-[acyl-carrier protein] reductase
MRMKDRVALVTGASQGIGEAIARQLASEGALVVCAARRVEKLEHLVAEIGGAGYRALALPMDVGDAGAIAEGVRRALETHGRIDILINNAGVTEDNLILRMSRDAWDRVLATNLTAAFLLCQAVARPMVKNRYGRIVNITSVVGLMGNAGQANYAASKAGLVGLTKSLARELGSRNVTVNAVAPGFIATAMTEKMTEEARQALFAQIPLGRLGTAEDVARAVAFLASEEAAYVTGHVMNVSGGLYM